MADLRKRFTDFLRTNAGRAGELLTRARDQIADTLANLGRGDRENYQTRFLRYYNSAQGRADRAGGSSDGLAKARDTIRGKQGRIKPGVVAPQGLQDNHVGGLYLYAYRSKWFYKDQLPYYDAFPLVFLISPTATTRDGKVASDKFLGINFHYLSPRQRALLMDALNARLLRNGFDELSPNYNPRLYARISYQVLRAAARHRAFQPAVKMYLKSNATRMVRIPGDQWEQLLFLPIARWRFNNHQRFSNRAKNEASIWRETTQRGN